MYLGGMEESFVLFHSQDLGVHCASIVQMCLSCLIDLNSSLYHLRGSLQGLDTFWARGLSWMNKETITTIHLWPATVLKRICTSVHTVRMPHEFFLSLLNFARTVLSKFRVRKWYTWASDKDFRGARLLTNSEITSILRYKYRQPCFPYGQECTLSRSWKVYAGILSNNLKHIIWIYVTYFRFWNQVGAVTILSSRAR